MFYPGQNLREYCSSLQKIMEKRVEYDHIYTCHGTYVTDIHMVRALLQCTQKILDGALQGEAATVYDGSTCRIYRDEQAAIYYT
jgi:hypothetical protein